MQKNIKNFIIKCWAFLKRDFINEVSYKFSFFLQFFGIFTSILVFFFLSKLFEGQEIPHLKPYGGNYFAFVLIGIAFSNYLNVAIRSLSKSIRDAQMMGTLEALLVTQTEIPTIILGSSIYSYLFTSFQVLLYLVLGGVLFGVNFGSANYLGALVILIFTIASFGSVGIISASFIMIFKRGDPATWLITSLSWLLGGVYYPIEVLPDWLEKLSYLLPITYSLNGMRLALLQGSSLIELKLNILALLIFTLVLLPVSLFIFSRAVKKAKHDGSLAQY
ncbi:ABC transporter permease [candidate division KSB1 bacterium]|nr:ABC transporter permease [candidate division KSB1 bacterium]